MLFGSPTCVVTLRVRRNEVLVSEPHRGRIRAECKPVAQRSACSPRWRPSVWRPMNRRNRIIPNVLVPAVALVVGVFASGCPKPPTGSTASSGGDATLVAPGARAQGPIGVDASKEPPPGAKVAVSSGPVRILHPLGGSGESCLEMYSWCRPGEGGREECTSVPLTIWCGESAVLPTTHETLKCLCP